MGFATVCHNWGNRQDLIDSRQPNRVTARGNAFIRFDGVYSSAPSTVPVSVGNTKPLGMLRGQLTQGIGLCMIRLIPTPSDTSL